MTKLLGLDYQNRILRSLVAADLVLLRPHLHFRDLAFRHRLEVANRTIEHVYFLETGLASVVAMSGRGRRQVEVALIGAEGMTGQAIVLGTDRSPNDVIMQVAGSGFSVNAGLLHALAHERPTMMEFFVRFAHLLAVQTGQTVLANSIGSIEERLSRWLLMSQDRVGEQVNLTHEFLAIMLGVRRPGITIALQRLEHLGLVATSRGAVLILDRTGLETAANGLYGVPEAEYQRIFAV